MAVKSLEDGLMDELKDILSAEKQLLRALPKMAKAASSPELKQALENHLKETEQHVQRVEQAFEAMDRKPKSHKCEAMEGLIDEGEEILKQDGEPHVLDAMIIAAAQKIEHYEIASYGTICTWADMLGLDRVAEPLKKTMSEEKEADQKLTNLAREVNRLAMAG